LIATGRNLADGSHGQRHGRFFKNSLTIDGVTLSGTAGSPTSGFLVRLDSTMGIAVDGVAFPSTSYVNDAKLSVNAAGDIAVAVRLCLACEEKMYIWAVTDAAGPSHAAMMLATFLIQ